MLVAPPAEGKQAGMFQYRFVMTPEEGPLDPAIEQRHSREFDQCQARAVSTRDNEACFAAEFARQDEHLNRVWRQTLERIGPRLRAQLVSAQRNWIAKRDPFCGSKADEFRGGTIVPIVYEDCRVEQTIRRTMWLEGLH